MKNALQELKNVLTRIDKTFDDIQCACVSFNCDLYFRSDVYMEYFIEENIFKLRLNYTESELERFKSFLDTEYDNDYGEQELFGIIWLKDGAWLERGEYDGSEWWEYKVTPEIPKYLKSDEEK